MSQISIFLADLDVIFLGYPEIRKFEISFEFLRKKIMLVDYDREFFRGLGYSKTPLLFEAFSIP